MFVLVHCVVGVLYVLYEVIYLLLYLFSACKILIEESLSDL